MVRTRHVAAAALVAVAASTFAPDAADAVARRWGQDGHVMIGTAAAQALPAEMPAFFRQSAAQLGWLNYEPDRWRVPRDSGLDRASDMHASDHYVDLELLPAGALAAPTRYAYADSLHRDSVSTAVAGVLPYRVLEMTERLRVDFALWRAATDSAERRWLEQRILNDAGILGHYVADGANPHHTTIHYDGWTGENPRGYTPRGTRFHSRFESEFVRAQLRPADLAGRITEPPRVLTPLRDSLLAYLHTSHGQLERLYALDTQERFGAGTRSAAHKAFAVDRMTAGARMLRDVWWTAWVTSGK